MLFNTENLYSDMNKTFPNKYFSISIAFFSNKLRLGHFYLSESDKLTLHVWSCQQSDSSKSQSNPANYKYQKAIRDFIFLIS